MLLIHAALLFALLHLSGQIDLTDPQNVLKTFNVIDPPPPPRTIPPPPPRAADKAKPKQKEGGSSPKNIKSEATPIKAPKPRVKPLLPNPVVVAETPRQGVQATQGASTITGPGTGAGGNGTGTGSGNGGNGPGGGGGGGVAVPVALVRGITSRDYPPAIGQSWPRGATIFLRLRIEATGRPSGCDVMRGFGNPAADQWTCSLIMQRGVFRPARDGAGRPVAAWFGYKQSDRDR
ncbi:MAG: energy transducer TonB [Sphingomicrobium sp.]